MEQFCFAYHNGFISELPEHIQQLVDKAKEAAKHAYAPYSGFKVGAAVLLSDGSIRTGVNHENASFPAGICAERSVLANLNPFEAEFRVVAIAVTNLGAESTAPLSPCGICRQTIVEQQLAQNSPIAVYMCSTAGGFTYVEDATALLPFYFSSGHLDAQK